MSRRQSFPQTNRLNSTAMEEIKDLKLQIQLKNHEIEDLKFELNTLRKKQSIWHHLGETYEKQNVQQERKQIVEENEKLKSQIVSMLNEIQQKNMIVQEQKQKINDLKQYNQQLKKLSEKTQFLHKKEMEVLKNSLDSSAEIVQLKKQKQKLEVALSKCDIIGKQMEQYYMNEIQTLKNQLEEQKKVIIRLQDSKNMFQGELAKKQYELKEMKTKVLQNESRWKESDFSELIKRQNQEKKYELIVNQMKERYEKQIIELKEQIKFLVVKVESLQDSKNYCEGLTASILTQSKLAMSSLSNDSFRFTPNNSFSSSIKESLSKRDAPLRTPSKSGRQSNGFGFLLDRTNL